MKHCIYLILILAINNTHCLLMYLEGKLGCHSPWVNLNLNTSVDVCSDDKLPMYMDIMQQLQTMSEAKMYEETGCMPKFHRRKFSMAKLSEQVNYVIPGRTVR